MNEPRWQLKFEVKPGSWVYVPTIEIAKQGRKLHQGLWSKYQKIIPKNYFHLRLGGHLSALHHHLDDHFFCHLDISNFFGSISRTRITRALKDKLGYDIARNIAKLSTVPVSNNQPFSHCLPYGFIQSPIIASICLAQSHLGESIIKIENKCDVRISLYMDDLIVSGKDLTKTITAFETLKVSAHRSHFTLNEKKECTPNTLIECFNIRLSHQHISLTKDRMHQFVLQHVQGNEHVQDGILSYIQSVNPMQIPIFEKMLSDYYSNNIE
ncbi:TPA: reverse transcriptase domain-containing protein [Aeromonas veronii]